MARFPQIAVITVLILLFAPSISYADSCGASGSRAHALIRSPELAQLRRQDAALQMLQRKRQCSAEKSNGGLFNPCRDLASQRADVRRRIDVLLDSDGGQAASRKRRAEQSCVATPRRKKAESDDAEALFSGTPILYCVRLSDGYLFPAPHSQFVRSNAVDQTRNQCQYICRDRGIEVYALTDPRRETENMVSVKDGASYKDLPTAFQYRTNANFERCDWGRYVHRVLELKMAALKGTDMTAPVPIARPQVATVRQPVPEDNGERRVRIVGPVYIPLDDEDGSDVEMTGSTKGGPIDPYAPDAAATSGAPLPGQ